MTVHRVSYKQLGEKVEGVVDENDITLIGFLFLHALFIEKGRMETIWTVPRTYGYNNELRPLDDKSISCSFKRSPDQTVELTNEAIYFLGEIYDGFDDNGDNSLGPAEVEDLFFTAPENPWKDAHDAAEKTESGGLSLHGFLSLWELLTLLDTACSVETLVCIGYRNHVSSAFRVTRQRRQDLKKQQTDRNVFQCFVFGPKKAGKFTLLNAFLERPFSDSYTPGGALKTLVLRESSKDDVLSTEKCLAACDVAVFVHDSSSEISCTEAIELLDKVARHGKCTGYKVPCLIVAAKTDLDSLPMPIEDSTKASQYMGIEAPIPIKIKSGNFNDIYRKIINAATHPHLSIPTI